MTARLLALLNGNGGKADLDLASDVVVLRDGRPLSLSEVPGEFVGKLLENAALVEVAASKDEIINGRGFPSGEC